ncbi:hypothetical protein APHMUC_1638 [Anaplasma phagocytophilum str. ApMUC09]|uniref:Uncharacterized protein n=1 Tax=Anaplasma phagocytophilum str. ApMUC09 TaxID=1359152 RepID=A0A0F3N8R7_ANAPH|nr:hypothetical protein APHMUC_1638 [Anaplasma phagocytophilum str. ApMUC09]
MCVISCCYNALCYMCMLWDIDIGRFQHTLCACAGAAIV